jgi:hypothetical protein
VCLTPTRFNTMIGISRTTCLTLRKTSHPALLDLRCISRATATGGASRSNSRPAASFAAPATSYPSDTRLLQRSLGGSILRDHQDSRQDMHPWDRNHRIRHGTQTRNSSRVGYRPPLSSQQLSGSSLTGGSFYHLVAAPSQTGGFNHRTVFRCKKTRLFVGPWASRACLEFYF